MMNLNPYDSSERARASVTDQAAQEAEHELTRTPAGSAGEAAATGAAPAGPGDGAAALHTISAGIRSGISPLQFMDSIDAGGQQMGNRAFMHWVEQVHTGTAEGATHGIAAQGLQGPGRPLTHLDTLQQAFGHHDIRAMREHTGAVAGSALDALDAEGYTRGGRMALAGAPDLYTQAHEAAHGVQQAALGDRLMLPGGIGVAGDRYERQADAVADAVLRGESAQPLLDQVTAGPVQVSAASAGAAAPVQMRRKKNKRRNQPRPGDLTGDNVPAPEQVALEMADLAGPAGDPSPDTGSMELEPVHEFPDTGQVIVNPLYDESAEVSAESEQTTATLEQVAQQLEPLIQEPDVPQPAGNMDVQQVEGAVGNVAEDIVPAPQPPDQDILPDAGGPDLGVEGLEQYLDDTAQPEAGGKLAECLKYLKRQISKLPASLYPQAQPDGPNDKRGSLQRYIKYFFPLIVYLYNALTERAGQIQTEAHGVLSLRGILNALATVMLGLFMVGVALPLDVVGNILGVVARFFILICDITGKPAEIWLNRHLPQNPQPEEEPARAAPQSHCVRFLNVFLPQTLITSGASAYFRASIVQGSLSPSLWILEWTKERIGVVCGRIIQDNLVFILVLNLGPLLAMRVLVKMLKWGQTLAALFPVILINVLGVVVDYITAYNVSPEVTVFQPWYSLRTGVELGAEDQSVASADHELAPALETDALTPNEATATFFGYAALGMLIQFVSGVLVFYHILARINAESMAPWLTRFFEIPNRLYRMIAVALASMRNAILTVMAVTNIMGLIVSNIIGPLSREFGSGGFCLWPMAAAGVCGGVPEDFDFVSLFNQIELGKEELPESHLTAIQTFPGIVGILGVGIPIGIIIVQLLARYFKAKFKPRRRGAGRSDRGVTGATGRGPARRDRGRRFRGRRRAESGERISLAEEGGTLGRAADTDEGEANEPVCETIAAPGGTLRRQRPHRHRPLPPMPQQATVTLEEDPPPAEFSPEAASLHGGAEPAALGTHSPQPSITGQANGMSIHSNEAQLQDYLLDLAGTQPGLYEHDMVTTVNSWVEQRRINEREAERVKEWAKDTLLFRR